MDPLALARWQFGITTVYHFLFVPLTIGLALLMAIVETAWVRTRNPVYLRTVKFWGKLFLINFAIGVATGIVQEFQFGMNWSSYSRFVGDVFGAPLAMEGLVAFFLESTFLGLWIFGWDRLSPRLHAACMWLVSAGTIASAYFILAANSFMQHPVGIEVDSATGRPRLTDIGAVLFQPLQLVTFGHVLAACLLTGAVVMTGVSAYFLARRRDVDVFRPSLRLGLVGVVIGSLAVIVSGDVQGRVMTDVQPMKMAAAEALYDTTSHASLSLLSIGTLDGSRETFAVRVPGLLSFMATGGVKGTVEGINDIQQQYQQRFGPGDYRPNIPVTYWTFRAMMGIGFALLAVGLAGLWLTRRRRLPDRAWVWRLATLAIVLPFVGNSVGWIFTEMGRQPWTVFGLFTTSESVSPTVTGGEVLTSLVVFTGLYAVLAVINLRLMARHAKAGPVSTADALASVRRRDRPGDGEGGSSATEGQDAPLSFAY